MFELNYKKELHIIKSHDECDFINEWMNEKWIASKRTAHSGVGCWTAIQQTTKER